MRKKEDRNTFGVADGFDFGTDTDDVPVSRTEIPAEKPKAIALIPTKQKKTTNKAEKVVIDPDRNYSPYYTPKPKKGAKGGTLGRGAVDEGQRKVQFSLTCTPDQKAKFMEAAQKDRRKLPDFICMAVEEYIKNNNLL